MKTECIMLLLLFSSIFSPVQRISVGTPYDEVEAYRKFYFALGNYTLAVKVEGNTVWIETFPTDRLSLKQKKVYNDFPNDAVIENVLQFGDKHYVFYTLWDTKKELLFVREINYVTGEFVNSGNKILESTKINGILEQHAFQRLPKQEKFFFSISNDRTKLLVHYTLVPELRDNKANHEVIGLHVFSTDLIKEWGGTFKMLIQKTRWNAHVMKLTETATHT